MSNVLDRANQFAPIPPRSQQISGLLNYPESPPEHEHSYPDPRQLHTAPTHSPLQPQYVTQGSISPAEAARGRLRKACDSCSVRKVKVCVPLPTYCWYHMTDSFQCDEGGPPCKSCAALDIPCTFERPSRRRGPPNRHAEAIKRQRAEHSVGRDDSPATSPDNGRFNTSMLGAEAICPLPTLKLLIDDYFKYIHPLIPLPHEPTIRMQLQRRDDNISGTCGQYGCYIGCIIPQTPATTSEPGRKQEALPQCRYFDQNLPKGCCRSSRTRLPFRQPHAL